MRPFQGISGWLPVVLLTACAASQTGEPMALRPAPDRFLTAGDRQLAEEHLHAFGVDPGPADGRFTAQTQAAVRAFQARYGLPVSGLLDRATRAELQLGGRAGEQANQDWGLCGVLGGTMLNAELVR